MFSPRIPTATATPCFALLADLDLSDNKLTSVPASLFTACPNLTHVSFARNEIRDLPSEKRQGNTRPRGDPAGDNAASAASNTTTWPTNLVSLDISHNRLTQLPASMGSAAHSLTYLDVSRNAIRSVPASMFEPKRERLFSSLRTFLLQHNALSGDSALPPVLPVALSESCRRLDLSHNGLTALPSDIGSMQALRELFVNHNELASFPSGVGSAHAGRGEGEEIMLPNVTSLRLENNRLSVLPPRFGKFVSLSTRLQHLSLQNNRLVALPEMVARPRPQRGDARGDAAFVAGLLTLDASHNRVVQLPRSIGEAVGGSLLQLRLAHNRIESLPVSSFARLRKLQDLTLHGNPLLSTELRAVVSSGSYTPPLARQVANVVRKIFDAIKDNWGEVDTRVHTAVTKLRRNLAKKGKKSRAQSHGSGDGSGGGGGGGGVSGAMKATEEGSALANTTDELLGNKRLFRSLNVTYQRLQACLKKFDSSGGAHGGRLDAVEFRTAIEAVGMYLTEDECEFLTAFALEACSPRVNAESRRTTRNTGCVGIREFIAEVLRPGSTSSSSGEGVAQAVVSFCVDLAGRKARILNKHGSGQNSARKYASGQSGFEGPATGTRSQGEFQTANREMRSQLRSLQKKQKQWESKASEAEQFVEGRGPRPKWMRDMAPAAAKGKTGKKGSGSSSMYDNTNQALRNREDTVFRAKITHEKLRQKKRLLQQKIRQEAARTRRLEIKAATDPTLKNVAYKEPGLTRAATNALDRATDKPVGRSGERHRSQQQGPQVGAGRGDRHKPLRALIASIRGGIEMDERFAAVKSNEEKANAFFDFLKAEVRVRFRFRSRIRFLFMTHLLVFFFSLSHYFFPLLYIINRSAPRAWSCRPRCTRKRTTRSPAARSSVVFGKCTPFLCCFLPSSAQTFSRSLGAPRTSKWVAELRERTFCVPLPAPCRATRAGLIMRGANAWRGTRSSRRRRLLETCGASRAKAAQPALATQGATRCAAAAAFSAAVRRAPRRRPRRRVGVLVGVRSWSKCFSWAGAACRPRN
jgi:Leucine-rich repeat (LRR) protein